MNRTYNSGQSRFTQVDPIGMASANIGNPQSLNLFAYTQNNPVDFTDASGLCTFGLVTSISPDLNRLLRLLFAQNNRVLEEMRNELTRIFEDAGHSIDINGTAPTSGTYTTVFDGSRGSLASTFVNGGRYNNGVVRLETLRTKAIGAVVGSPSGLGRALGRIIAHEIVAHFLLKLSNGTGPGMHTTDGLTRESFGNEQFGLNASRFNISSEQARILDLFCEKDEDIPIGGGDTIARSEPTESNFYDDVDSHFDALELLSRRTHVEVIILDDEE